MEVNPTTTNHVRGNEARALWRRIATNVWGGGHPCRPSQLLRRCAHARSAASAGTVRAEVADPFNQSLRNRSKKPREKAYGAGRSWGSRNRCELSTDGTDPRHDLSRSRQLVPSPRWRRRIDDHTGARCQREGRLARQSTGNAGWLSIVRWPRMPAAVFRKRDHQGHEVVVNLWMGGGHGEAPNVMIIYQLVHDQRAAAP
jgi:hypothetical protein